MSVDIEKLIVDSGNDPEEYVTTPKYIGSVAFTAQSIRDLDLMVGYNPVDGNPHHGEVWGAGGRPNKFSNSQKRGLIAAAEWYVQIHDVEII